jgi:hypothetical protein
MAILQVLDETLPPIHWGATEGAVRSLLPGGREGPGPRYAVEACVVGYPFPILLFFSFDPDRGLSAIDVEYPRSFDLASDDMQLPGRMVAESIHRHLSALLIIALGGVPRTPEAPPVAGGNGTVLAEQIWTTRDSTVRLEFRLQSGLGRVRVEMRALPG